MINQIFWHVTLFLMPRKLLHSTRFGFLFFLEREWFNNKRTNTNSDTNSLFLFFSFSCFFEKKVMKKLPEVNRSVFHAISILCYNVMCHSDVNKMTANNLGIVFAPSCLYSQSNDPSALEKSLDANALVSYIFQNIDVVF